MTPNYEVKTLQTERIFPAMQVRSETVVALSLLDATTANFAFTSALWLLERPDISHSHSDDTFDLTHHLRQSLSAALDAYPQWCGQLKGVASVDGTVEDEAARQLPPHSRRHGRVYALYGVAEQDPGVEFIAATSSATLDILYPAARTEQQPLWNQDGIPMNQLGPPTRIASALEPNVPVAEGGGLRKPLMAIQITELACGGIALGVKGAHPLADITTLISFVKDWARVSHLTLEGAPVPLSDASILFKPELLDSKAAGNINADEPDSAIINLAKSLPLHRYDWWTSPGGPAWATIVPDVFQKDAEPLSPAGKRLPWAEWDFTAPVSSRIVHLTHDQINFLWTEATQSSDLGSLRISKHDAILAHIWSCIARARNLREDKDPVHCDLVLGVRPALKLGNGFLGSPIIMANIEMAGADVAAPSEEKGKKTTGLGRIVGRIRETLNTASDPANLAAHLHSVAFEKSPQRLWQAFLGRRHILVTTWARSGIYDVDFGIGSKIRYADAVLGAMDGGVLIKEGPPSPSASSSLPSASVWTENGVDITIHLRTEDMERLLLDPLLLPVRS